MKSFDERLMSVFVNAARSSESTGLLQPDRKSSPKQVLNLAKMWVHNQIPEFNSLCAHRSFHFDFVFFGFGFILTTELT